MEKESFMGVQITSIKRSFDELINTDCDPHHQQERTEHEII